MKKYSSKKTKKGKLAYRTPSSFRGKKKIGSTQKKERNKKTFYL